MRGAWIGCLLGAMALTACGGDDDVAYPGANDVAIRNEPLTGRVGGQEWTSVLAEIRDRTIFFFVAPREVCSRTFFEDSVVGAEFTGVVGRQYLDEVHPGTIDVPRADDTGLWDHMVATKGRIVVDEITDDRVRGGAHLHVDEQNTVNGRFEATVCR